MERQEIIPLPEEYGQKIIDGKGNMLDVAANAKHLFVRTLVNEPGILDFVHQADTICVPLDDALRLIMTIACVARYSGGFDEKISELLGAIEVVARYGIARQCKELPVAQADEIEHKTS